MKQYLDLLQDVLENGFIRSDRTGVGTISVCGRQMRFNLKDGFPAITTKKLAFKSVVSELLWFIEGSSNERRLAEIHYGLPSSRLKDKKTIWYENANAPYWSPNAKYEGDLGKMYGIQWRSLESIHFNEKRTYEIDDQKIKVPFDTNIVLDFTSNTVGLIGKTFTSKCGDYVVIKENIAQKPVINGYKQGNYKKYDVKFINTGFIKTDCSLTTVKKGLIKDAYYPSVLGIGCCGITDDMSLYQTWVGMLKRCYDPKHLGYKNYGGKGIFVCNRWLIYENFINDVKNIPGWLLKKTFPDEYSLDKDFYCSNRYSKDDCIWSSKEEQSINTDNITPFVGISPDGDKILFSSIKFACKKFGFIPCSINSVLNGEIKTHHNWTFEKIDFINIPRVRIHDQIANAISLIKNDPNSRRIIVDAYNVGDLDEMCLTPCHPWIQFFVRDNKLTCMVTIRSNDLFLGNPFNVASYALLTHMISQVCNLDVGELIVSVGDAHIYLNHIEQVKEQLSREPYPLPKLWLNPEIKNIDDFTMDDIKLEDYQSHATIKAEMAV